MRRQWGLIGLFSLLAGAAVAQTPAQIPPQPAATPGKVHVIDADTVEQDGHRYRLKGFDAPEIHHAKCPAEREAGVKAAARLVELLAQRPHALEMINRSGGFGRRLGRLTIAGEAGIMEDWAVIAVREGHGVACAGRCERKAHDWCKR